MGSAWVFYPTVRGIIQADFDFIHSVPGLGYLVGRVMVVFGERQAVVFGTLIIFILLAAILKNVFAYFSRITTLSIVRMFANNLRKNIYRRYLKFGKLFYDRNSMGELYQTLVGFTQSISTELNSFERCVEQFFSLFVYLGIMVFISWELTLLICLVFPVFHFVLQSVIRHIKEGSRNYQRSYSEMARKISNALACMPLVKAYNLEEKEKEWFDYTSERVKKYEHVIDKKRSLVSPIQEVLLLFVIVVLVGAISYIYTKGDRGDIAGYLVFFIVLKRAMSSMGAFGNLRASLASIRGPMGSILAVFSDKEKYFVDPGKIAFTGIENEITFDGLTFAYPENREVLEEISFSVKKGEKAL